MRAMYRHILAAAPQKCNVDSNKQNKKRTNNKLSDDFFPLLLFFMFLSVNFQSSRSTCTGNGRTHTHTPVRRWLLTIEIIRNELDGTQVSLSVDWMDATVAETRVAVATRNDSDMIRLQARVYAVRSRLCISSSIFRSRITRESRYPLSRLHGSQLNAAFVPTVMRYLNKATTENGPRIGQFFIQKRSTRLTRSELVWPMRPWMERRKKNSRRCSTSCSKCSGTVKNDDGARVRTHNSHGFVRCNVSKMPAWRWLILFRALNEVANDT